MSSLIWILITFLGQLLTSAITIQHIYEQIAEEQASLEKDKHPGLAESGNIRRELSFNMKMSDLKEVFHTYSKFVFLDVVFEVLKTVFIFFARLYVNSPELKAR